MLSKVVAGGSSWRTYCALLVIPLTALFHHAVFTDRTCMLNGIGDDYTPSVIARWLAQDPSLPWAMVAAFVAYRAGRTSRLVRLAAAPVFWAFLPLSLWIWDIPFTGRFVCDHFHDDQLRLFDGVPMRSRYLYLVGGILYVLLLGLMVRRERARGRSAAPA